MKISETAREKLISHARFIFFYQSLADEDRRSFLENLRESMVHQGTETDIAVDLAHTLEHYLQVDPHGGVFNPALSYKILGQMHE